MLDSGLPKSMRVLDVNATVHAYNRTLHKTIEFRVPLEKFAPSASCHFNQIKRLGCIGFVKIPKPDFKFGERAIKTVLVGYNTTGYLLRHPSSRKFIEFRHVRFNEKVVYKDVYEVLSLSSERQVAPGFVSPVHSNTVKFIVVLACS